jgi:large conductance mechanosensitive channel
MIKILKEFREFAVKGNMFDIAIGVIIGASFNNVIDTLVKNILLPILSLLTDSKYLITSNIGLKEDRYGERNKLFTDEVSLNLGSFLGSIIDFLIISFTIFLVVKFLNKIKNKAEDPDDKSVSTPVNIELLSKINTELIEIKNKMK